MESPFSSSASGVDILSFTFLSFPLEKFRDMSCFFFLEFGEPTLLPIPLDLTKDSSLEIWNSHKGNDQKYVNSYWLDSNINTFSRWPKTIRRSNFKLEYKDLIILLSRICFLKDSNDFEPWMFKFIFQIMNNKENIFRGS